MEHTTHSRDETLLNSLKAIVLRNLENEQFGVAELCREAAISRFQLHRKLKSLKGTSVSQFIRETRLEEAMKLLKRDVGTASEIAFRVGFSSPSYFNKCFQKHYGLPPGEVKKMKEGSAGSVDVRTGAATAENEVRTVETEIRTWVFPRAKKYARIFQWGLLLTFIGTFLYFIRHDEAPADREISIAVLPLSNLSPDPDNQFFADGIVEDLLNRLSMIAGFKVISRTSSEMFREKGAKSVPQIGRELGVSYIIEGSVQRHANRARINIQLIDARSDVHVWSKLFDTDLNDIFKTQSEIAIQIATELNTVLTEQQTIDIQKNRTSTVKAFELYQLGRFHWNKRTGEGYATSIDYFEQAIAEDPGYGLAYAGLADTYNLMALQGWIEEKQGSDSAVALAFKALELDPSLAEAHTVLASIYTYIDMDWEAADREYLRAIELNPNYSTVHHYYSEHLSIIGEHEEAREEINKALELDPLSFVIRYVSTKLYFNRGLFREALAENQRCHELGNNHRWPAWYDFAINYQLGNDRGALEGFRQYGAISGQYDPASADSVFEISGLDGLLKWQIELSDVSYLKAEWYGLLGDDEKAMVLLEKAFNEGDFNTEFTFKYVFHNLRADPRYQALLQRMGLPGT